MTLVGSGNPISLGGSVTNESVNVEIGHSPTATITMDDAAVAYLAGVTQGTTISMYEFYGKTYASGWRPTTYAESGVALTTLTNPTYVWTPSNTSTTVDTTTACVSILSMSSGSGTGYLTYSGFPFAGTRTGTLYIYVFTLTHDNLSSNGLNETQSSVEITYSTDGGSTWNSWEYADSGSDLSGQYSISLLSVVVNNLKVQIEYDAQGAYGSGTGQVNAANAQATIYDIVFVG